MVSYGLRAYSWRKYRAYVDVQAIQVSLLGGRIFFKGLRYHGANETILIHSGHVTWRYWYRKVKEVDCARKLDRKDGAEDTSRGSSRRTVFEREKGGLDVSTNSLPCRLLISVHGLEWFLYNRSAAYDAIVASVLGEDGTDISSTNLSSSASHSMPSADVKGESFVLSQNDKQELHSGALSTCPDDPKRLTDTTTCHRHATQEGEDRPKSLSGSEPKKPAQGPPGSVVNGQPSDLPLLNVFPVRIECNKGAIVMGNESVRCVLTVKFDRASGEIDASYCHPPDRYKQLINFHFTHPVMQMKPNLSYKASPSSALPKAESTNMERASTEASPNTRRHRLAEKLKAWQLFGKAKPAYTNLMGSLHSRSPRTSEQLNYRRSRDVAQRRWLGLSRYLDDDDRDDHATWRSVEYARSSTILDSPGLSMSYYWDVAGIVTAIDTPGIGVSSAIPNANRAPPPEWGLDLAFEGGTFNYGPWADRHRAELQTIFFPRLYKDAVLAPTLALGETRRSTVFTLFVELRDQTTLRIPIREFSKDSKWKVRAETFNSSHKSGKGKHKKKQNKNKKDSKASSGLEVRPFGWLDIKVLRDSTIRYVADMAASAEGYHSSLDLDFRGTEVMTSVNHALLLRSQAMRFACNLPTPRRWNGLHQWKFQVIGNTSEVFLIREHIFLFSDLTTDWSADSLPDYYTFVPFEYIADIQLRDLKLYLNANDANIINNPCDIEDNTFVVIKGSHVNSKITIPIKRYRPEWNEIPFQINGHDCQVSLLTPPWKTQSAFFGSGDVGPGDVGSLKDVSLTGRYGYFTTTSPLLTDTLVLDIHGSAISIDLFGFVIRSLMKLKDNYFGEDIHFKTLEEYQALQADRDIMTQDGDEPRKTHKKSNDLDVIINIDADDAYINLPANLYAAKNGILIFVECINFDLRFTNYYMDLAVTFSPLSASARVDNSTPASSQDYVLDTQMFVDGLNIHSHRLFGLPPTEPTYMCNWDFHMGPITGECSVQFLRQFSSSLKSFGFSFSDDENALPNSHSSTIHDVTFLRARLQSVSVWLHVGQAAFLISTAGIRFDFNDWATENLSQCLELFIPNIRFACVSSDAVSRHSTASPSDFTDGYLETTLSLTVIEKKREDKINFWEQQRHIERHDSRTARTRFLCRQNKKDFYVQPTGEAQAQPATMPLPPMSSPVTGLDTLESKKSPRRESGVNSSFSCASSRKSSFLSLAHSRTSSAQAVDKPRLSSRMPLLPTHLPVRVQGNTSLESRRLWSAFASTDVSAPDNASRLTKSNGNLLHVASADFCSPFLSPHFPFEGIRPAQDSSTLLAQTQYEFDRDEPHQFLQTAFPVTLDDDSTSTAVLIRLGSGVMAFGKPRAVTSIIQFLKQMQAEDPTDMLDHLQTEVLSKVCDSAKQRFKAGKTVDIKLRVPFVRCRFSDVYPERRFIPKRHSDDEYNLQLSQLSLLARLRNHPNQTYENLEALKPTSFHMDLNSASISIGEKSGDHHHLHSALQGHIDQFVCAFSESTILSVIVQLRGLEVTAQSRKVEYLSHLISHITAYTQTISESFIQVEKEEKERLQALVFSLMSRGKDVPDPISLTRPSYLLRAASDHLRLSDSWKVISRLRQIHQNFSPDMRDEIQRGISNHSFDAQSQVVQTLGEWRSWELAHVRQSYVIQKLYGSLNISPGAVKPVIPVKTTVRTRSIKLLVDPGPKQSELGLETLTISTATNIRHANTTTLSYPSLDPRTTTIEIHSLQTTIKLNWELCELADDLLKAYQRRTQGPTVEQLTTQEPKSVSTARHHNFHVVCVTDVGTVMLNSISITSVSACKGLRASGVVHRNVGQQDSLSGLALHATAASSEVISQGHILGGAKLIGANVCLSVEQKLINDEHLRIWKLAGTCQELTCNIEEELPGVIETMELIVRDEVAYLRNLFSQASATLVHGKPVEIANQENSTRIYVALFLTSYSIRLALLQSLSYVTSGNVARASFMPDSGSGFVFDFDLKEQLHQVLLQTKGGEDSLSVLRMPPINGRVVACRTYTHNQCQATVSVDTIRFEAAAISSLLATVSRPELISIAKEIVTDCKAVKMRVDEVFKRDDQVVLATSASPTPFVYDCRLAVAGVEVHARGSTHDFESKTCQVELILGCLHIKAANQRNLKGPILSSPEVSLSFRRVSAELSYYHAALRQPCGSIEFSTDIGCCFTLDQTGRMAGAYRARIDALAIQLFVDTPSAALNILSSMQDTVKDLDLSREARYLRKLRKSRRTDPAVNRRDETEPEDAEKKVDLLGDTYSVEIINTQIKWVVDRTPHDSPVESVEDVVLLLKKVDLSTRKGSSAQLKIEDLQLQMLPAHYTSSQRSRHSALLPELLFNVAYLSTLDDRRLAFQAVGKLLDLRLTSQFIVPASAAGRSMAAAHRKFKMAVASWDKLSLPSEMEEKTKQIGKRFASVLIDADFAGAVVHVHGREARDSDTLTSPKSSTSNVAQQGRYEGSNSTTTLRAPGVAFKIEYKHDGVSHPSLNGEVKITSSTNVLYPTVVPLLLEISSSIKDAVREPVGVSDSILPEIPIQKAREDGFILHPGGILGHCKLNVGLRICKQDFSLNCQPVARVTATTGFEDVYITINTVRSSEDVQFLAISAIFSSLHASIRHVYSRESTGSLEIESLYLSLMNSKHLSGTSGISAILKVNPTKVSINTRQIQDFLLFRHIWIPADIHQSSNPTQFTSTKEPQALLVQRAHQVAGTSALPWNFVVAIAEVSVQLELGQALGRSSLTISNLWASSAKSSDWEQNLCLGFHKVAVHGSGRLSGLIELRECKVRTSIQWPSRPQALDKTPLVQASIGLENLRVKIAFDYQIFLLANVKSFDFFMYNVRHDPADKGDRLVAALEGDKIHLLWTATSAAQSLALYQAVVRLVQEKTAAFEASLNEIEQYLRRKSNAAVTPLPPNQTSVVDDKTWFKTPMSLHTDVVVRLKELNLSIFPSTVFDRQVLKIEVLNAWARFAVAMDRGRIHGSLGLTLGQLRIAVTSLRRITIPAKVEEVDIDEAVDRAIGSRDGTILKVPKVVVTMQTWQEPRSNHIDYIFKSSFEGKVDVGWNYSRIGFIRGLWSSHCRALAQRLGKPFSQSTVKITGAPQAELPGSESDRPLSSGAPEKITAVVNVPQSKYEYQALEPPIVETPQLRDMGEATPPLEWIGLHRERLPTLTHQIIIVALFGVAREVEDAYSRILGSS